MSTAPYCVASPQDGRLSESSLLPNGGIMRVPSRKTRGAVALLAASALVIAACGGDDSGSGPATTAPATATTLDQQNTEVEENVDERVYGGQVIIGLEAESNGFRPWEDSCSTNCYNMSVAVFDKLLEQTADGEFVPWLATSIEPNETLDEWTVTLRQGVSFHNGKAFNADTIIDMLPLQREGAGGSSSITGAGLADIEKVDEFTVKYILSKGNVSFPSFLERYGLGMVFDPEAAAADPVGFDSAPVGTGPFILVKRDIDAETVLERNPNYWGTDAQGNQLPYLDKLIFRPIPDEGTRLDSVVSGTVDAMVTLRQGTIRDARASSGIRLIEFQGNNAGGGMFNTARPPFDDVRVRLALVHANNQTAVIEALGGTGISASATQWYSPDSPWYSQKVADAWPKFDLARATELLTEYINDPERSDGLAVGSPIETELSCPPDPTLTAAMQVVQQTWEATGLVETTLTSFDQATHIGMAVGDQHHAHCWRWAAEGDNQAGLAVFLAPPELSPLNFPNWSTPLAQESFGLVQLAGSVLDFGQRYAAYEQIMLNIATEVPIWYSGHTAMAIAVAEDIQGLVNWTTPDGSLGAGISGAEARWSGVWRAEG
jgi:peptide/nickel transport system substrate-binding protein